MSRSRPTLHYILEINRCNNDITVPSFILPGALTLHHSRTKLGTHVQFIPHVDAAIDDEKAAYYVLGMIIRDELHSDIPIIRSVVTAAFKDAPHASGTEAAIVDRLRDGGALTLSLVAEMGDMVVGHVAFSPVLIDGKQIGWFGLGPVAVRNDMQQRGIGKSLIEAGLKRINSMGARGCVVLGEPTYYERFGFGSDANLRFVDVPAEYFQRLTIRGQPPTGNVEYHPAFY